MKKFICIGLACVMALSLAACGTGETKETTGVSAVAKAKDPVVTEAAKLTGTVSTDGSTSMEKVIGGLGEMFMEMNDGATFTYNPTGSSAGIKAIQEGRCDIGLASRNLKAAEAESGLTETVLAYDGIAVIVNPENTVEDLTVEQIAAIYKGEVTTGPRSAAMTQRSF